MYQIAINNEREELFINTAAKMGIDPAIVEKDFWVCLTLDYLFHHSKWKSAFAFKGGTSLSKAYNLIERFSEDIDLILDWRVIGYKKNEPWENRSNTKQQKFIIDSRERLFKFLSEEFLPEFKSDLENLLKQKLNIFISSDDVGTVNFEYPCFFKDDSILRIIRLEIGALAAWSPTQETTITPYVADCYPQIFEQKDTKIITTTAARTFWEKATILHQEAYRPLGSLIPARYSRHYYDVYCMANSKVKDDALALPELLTQVAEFKQKFYPRGWAKYELARIGTLKLYPAEHSIPEIRKDYYKMHNMIYGNYPNFDVILDSIKKLEDEINQNSKK